MGSDIEGHGKYATDTRKMIVMVMGQIWTLTVEEISSEIKYKMIRISSMITNETILLTSSQKAM